MVVNYTSRKLFKYEKLGVRKETYQHSLCARNLKCFITIHPLNPHNDLGEVSLSPGFHSCGNRSTER